MALSNADKQKAFRERMNDEGFVQCNVYVPSHALADFKLAAELAREDSALTVGQMKNVRTGRFQSLRKGRA